MSPEDESELHRLTEMLAKIDATLPDSSPLREALEKSGLALSYAFIDGRRFDIESVYDLDEVELSDAQRADLDSMGIDLDSDSDR
jgi:hypothetical protein